MARSPHRRRAFSTLVDHWAHLYVSTCRGGNVDVTAGANTFDSRSLAQVTLKVLERKRKKASTYDMAAPLWLILSITDQRGVFDNSLDVLENLSVAVEPYECVIVSYEERSIVWNRNGLRRTG